MQGGKLQNDLRSEKYYFDVRLSFGDVPRHGLAVGVVN